MINFVALSLLLSSLVTAGVLTPSQEPQTPHNDVVIVKEGHRAVIVEFEKETDGSTRVSISPPQQTHFPHKPISEEAATTAVEAAKAAKEKEKEQGKRQGPRELVCDTFGKCTHRIASVIGKAKEKVAEKAQEVEGGAKEVVGEAFGKFKETLFDTSWEFLLFQ